MQRRNFLKVPVIGAFTLHANPYFEANKSKIYPSMFNYDLGKLYIENIGLFPLV